MEKRQNRDFLKFPPTFSCENVRCRHVSSWPMRCRKRRNQSDSSLDAKTLLE